MDVWNAIAPAFALLLTAGILAAGVVAAVRGNSYRPIRQYRLEIERRRRNEWTRLARRKGN